MYLNTGVWLINVSINLTVVGNWFSKAQVNILLNSSNGNPQSDASYVYVSGTAQSQLTLNFMTVVYASTATEYINVYVIGQTQSTTPSYNWNILGSGSTTGLGVPTPPIYSVIRATKIA
jgi:hypothetical protein